jgi:hypothetical protein
VDATSLNVRNAFFAIFAAGATRTALTALAQRTGTRFEVLLSTAGPPNTAQVFGQILSPADVFLATRLRCTIWRTKPFSRWSSEAWFAPGFASIFSKSASGSARVTMAK